MIEEFKYINMQSTLATIIRNKTQSPYLLQIAIIIDINKCEVKVMVHINTLMHSQL